MNVPLLYHTLKHLRVKQLFYQCWCRLRKRRLVIVDCPFDIKRKWWVKPIGKPNSLLTNGSFEFVNIRSRYTSWNEQRYGNLWTYNLNYMDWLHQEGLDYKTGAAWIDRFVEEQTEIHLGMDPYPIALRSINWIKFISQHWDKIYPEQRKKWNDSLYSQILHLEKRLEYHLLGNHLLENLYALFIASLYFEDERLYKKVYKLLLRELDEEILSDGAHYELSPMYHCILLDRLLDCYNFSSQNICFEGQEQVTQKLKIYAQRMLGHLDSIVYSCGCDGEKTIPLLNDSACGISPTYDELCNYASRLGIAFHNIPLGECGYRKLTNERMEAIVDVGNITASYQPGHTHADTFNFELRIDGTPFIVDTGISTYNKTNRRQYERSTNAHNTVSVEGRNSSEVWGGFRVGRRARVKILADTPNKVKASHDGFKKALEFGEQCVHERTFDMLTNKWRVIDNVTGGKPAIAYLHLSPEVKIELCNNDKVQTSVADICFRGASKIEILDATVSKEYNIFEETKKIAVHFCDTLETEIIPINSSEISVNCGK